MNKCFRLSALASTIAALLLPMAAVAQTTINTGAIIGTLKDTSGAAMPGVTVTVNGARLQGSRTAVTDGQGEYVLPLLPPGQYQAEYELSGVGSQSRSGIVVNATQQTKVDVTLQLAVTETVNVTASQVVVDPTQTQQQQTLKEDHLKYTSVGSGNRSFQSAIGQIAEASGTGNAYIAGANQGMNTFMIDGINALTDPVTHTFASNMAFDAIQEMSIGTFGKDAEYRSSGGTINIITKSGGNHFSGSFDYRYSDPHYFSAGSKTYPAVPTYFGGPANGDPVLRFNKKTITDKSKQGQGTFGGPIMRDRLWFFGSGHRSETSRIAPNLFGFQPGSRDFTGWNTFYKLTFTPWSNHTFAGRFSDSHTLTTNTQFNSLVPPEADSRQTQHNKNQSLSYDGVVTSHWLLNAQIGHTPATLYTGPMTGDLRTPARSDADTGITSANYTFTLGRSIYRNELLVASTYYVEGFGTHAVKVGAYFEKSDLDSFNYRTGDPSLVTGLPADACARASASTTVQCGVSLSYRNGVPLQATLSVINPVLGAGQKGRSFYIQDQWNPIPRLTVRAGLRQDTVDWQSSKPIPSFKLLQPRLGVAYDVFNNGGSVIHAYGGKIIDENQLTLPNNLNVRYSGTATYTYNATTKAFAFTRTTISAGSLDVDPNLRAPFSNEYSLGVSQRVFSNTSLDITAEQRTAHNLFDDYYGTTTALLPTGIFTQCPYDECSLLRAQYRAIVAKVESRLTRNADLSFSWFHGTSKVSIDSTQNVAGTVNFFPTNFKNIYGNAPDDTRNRFKLNGFYRFPWAITAGLSSFWESSSPWTVTKTDPAGFGTEFLEPRGSRRFTHFYQVDAQLQKDFQIGPVKAGLIASVLNVLNTELPTGINTNAGTRAITDPATGRLYIDPNQQTGANRLSPTFTRYTSFQRPRRYEAGVRFEF